MAPGFIWFFCGSLPSFCLGLGFWGGNASAWCPPSPTTRSQQTGQHAIPRDISYTSSPSIRLACRVYPGNIMEITNMSVWFPGRISIYGGSDKCITPPLLNKKTLNKKWESRFYCKNLVTTKKPNKILLKSKKNPDSQWKLAFLIKERGVYWLSFNSGIQMQKLGRTNSEHVPFESSAKNQTVSRLPVDKFRWHFAQINHKNLPDFPIHLRLRSSGNPKTSLRKLQRDRFF